MKDELGNRMKSQYEDRTRYMLPRRTNTILRLDGRAFHTFTRTFRKPFDTILHDSLCDSAKILASEAQGCKFGYVQSDEASFLLTDYDRIPTEAWFDGNVQKIGSVASSIFTKAFDFPGASFDCRVFSIPDSIEVENYFVWRQKDAIRNSILSLAQYHYPHTELQGLGVRELISKMIGDNIKWEDELPKRARNGSMIIPLPVWVQNDADNWGTNRNQLTYHTNVIAVYE